MGSVLLTIRRISQLIIKQKTLKMSLRVFSDVSNLPITLESKRVTRASRKVLGDIPVKNQSQVVCKGKENVVDNLRGGQKKALRQPKVAVRRLNVLVDEQQDVPMEIEQDEVVCRIPEGVKDIDAEDSSNPQLCTEYALEIYAYLKQLEKRGSVRSDFLSGCPTSDKMRSVLVDWLVEVQIQFKLLQETLFLTVDTIDRFMALEGRSIPRAKLQLVGVSAMFLISKIEEVYAPAISDFVYITDHAYTDMDIRQMELRIIRALNFDLCQPISLDFLRRYSKAGEVDVLQHSLAKYTLEVCLLDFSLVNVSGSLLSSAALCLSLLILGKSASLDTVWSPPLEYYSGYSAEEVMAVIPRMASNVYKMNRNNKLQAVRTKYRSGKFLKVADIEELKSEKLVELAAGC